MSDNYYTTLARQYKQGKVINIRKNADIKRGVGNGTYKGSQINYEDKDGEVDSVKIAQSYLDLDWQAELKASIDTLANGDDVTVYIEKNAKTTDLAGKTDAEIKEEKIGNWGLQSVFKGHVIPPQMANAPASQSGGLTAADKGGYDSKGVTIGHGIKCAYRLLTPAKAKKTDVVIQAAKAFIDLSQKLQDDTGEKGASVGLAVLEAAGRAKEFSEVAELALETLNSVAPDVKEYVDEVFKARKAAKSAETKAANEAKKADEAREEVKEEVMEEPVENDFEDDDLDSIPF